MVANRLLRWPVAVCLSVGLLWAISAAGVAAEPVAQPNVIFILVDDLGYGDVGVFFQNARAARGDRSQPWHRTPGLDQLAAEGMRLPHHYCPAPVCAPSRASLLLGVHQGHANVRDNQFDKALEDNHTIASVLKAAGYRTAAIGKYGLQGGQEREEIEPPHWPAHPNRRGFDEFYGYIRHRDGHEHYPKEGIHRGAKEVWENQTEVSEGLDRCYTTDLFTARAKHFISEQVANDSDQPFFLYLAYDTPHAVLSIPTQAYPDGGGQAGGLQWIGEPGRMINTAGGEPDSYYHPDYAEATWDHDRDPATPEVAWPDVQKRYATVVRRIDDGIADLLMLLRDLSIDENTLIVFTNDNGPSIESYLSESFEPTFFQGYGPYDGIKRDLWEAGVHVGAIARWPAQIAAGSSSGNHATTFWDWLPTFAEAAGVAVPARSDGVSLLPLLCGEASRQPPSNVYIEYFQNGRTPRFDDFDPAHRGRRRNQMQMIREDQWVGVRYDIESHDDDFEIYHIVDDPRQSDDLATKMPELQRHMKDRVLRLRRPNESAPRPYDDEAVPAVPAGPTEPGVRWAAVDGQFAWVPRIGSDQSTRDGVVGHPANAIAVANRESSTAGTGTTTGTTTGTSADPVAATAVSVSGLIEVPETGDYTFSLTTDGRALMRIHEATVIDADAGYRAGETVRATVRLVAGKHPLRLDYCSHVAVDKRSVEDEAIEDEVEVAADSPLVLGWAGPGVTTGPVPEAAFSRSVIATQ